MKLRAGGRKCLVTVVELVWPHLHRQQNMHMEIIKWRERGEGVLLINTPWSYTIPCFQIGTIANVIFLYLC